MNLCAGTPTALLRASVIALLTLAIAAPIRDILVALPERKRPFAWAALLAPYLTPVVLVAYAYAAFALSLLSHPAWNQVFYTVVVALRLLPAAVIVLYFAPAPLTQEGLHCHRLLPSRAALASLAFRIRGAGRAPVIALALVFLFAFGEFEMASLWGIKTWTVTLFDAQTGGMALSASLRLACFPIACEAVVLFVAITLLFKSKLLPVSPAHRRTLPAMWKSAFTWIILAASALAMTIAPLFIVIGQAIPGFAAIARNFVLTKDIAASLLFATGAGCCSYFAAASVFKRPLPACLLSIPGLTGALLLSLQVLTLFQIPALRPLYNTPLPLLIALTLLLFPFALLLRLLLRATQSGPSLHLAAILGSRKLLWHLKTRRELWVAFLLFCWAYFDLTASSLAAPVGMTPVFVRLYNLMHYGQTAVLSAMVCSAFAAPVALLLLTSGARALWIFLRDPR